MEIDPISQEPQQTLSQKELLTILFRHKTKILTTLIAVVLTIIAVPFLLPKVFEAKSTLMVKIGREHMNQPGVGDNQPVMALNQGSVINSEIQILTNKELIRKVIETITPETLYPELGKERFSRTTAIEASIAEFEKNLTVEGIKNSSVIEVSFKHKNPQLAAQAVNMLVEFFREKHLQVFSDPQSSFLSKQLDTYGQKLKETESSLESFKQEKRIYSRAEQLTLLLKQRIDLDTNLKNTQNTISELQKRVVHLRHQLQAASESDTSYAQAGGDSGISDTKARLIALQLNEQDLLNKYTENNRLVVNARKDIAFVKESLREQEEALGKKAKTANPLYQEIKRDLVRAETDANALSSKGAAIKSQLRSVDAEIQSLELSENKLDNLRREKDINEKNYQTYSELAEKARITDEMNRLKLTNVSVIQSATAPIEPLRSKKRLNILQGLLIGVVAGIGMAFLAEYFRQDFTTPEKVERLLGIPVLASLPIKED